MSKDFSYFALYKPYGYLSQFTREIPEHKTLADLLEVGKDVYPVGRLDKDSEGLLLLTNDASVNKKLLHPSFGHEREYYAQVNGDVFTEKGDRAISELRNGPIISVKGNKYKSQPVRAYKMHNYTIEKRNPPIRYRKNVPTSWLSLTLTEGKNRQVRKICAAAGFPVLRLIRYRMEGITIENMNVGEYRKLTSQDFYARLNL